MEMDRLSDLPDSLLHHIISHLSTREACKTTILSKRWVRIWATCPVLDFEPWYFINKQLDLASMSSPEAEFLKAMQDKYLSYIESTMGRYSLNSLSISKLNFGFLYVDHELAPKINKWLEIGVNNHVEELSFSVAFKGTLQYTLPATLFSSKYLRSLRCEMIEIPCCEPNKFKSLQCLSLSHATINQDVLHHIINSCQLSMLKLAQCSGLESLVIPQDSKLKELFISWKEESGGIINVDVSSASLLHFSYLCLSYHRSIEEMEPWPCKIHVALRNLRTLKLCGTAITDSILAKLISGLVLLEKLDLIFCHLLQNIRIYGSVLKSLRLEDCERLTKVTIDTANLAMFTYCTCDPRPDIVFTTNIPPECKGFLCTDYDVFDTHWFIRLKGFLVQSNVFHILELMVPSVASMCKFDEDYAQKNSRVPPYNLGEVRIIWSIPFAAFRLSSLLTFIDGLLWSCHPSQLSVRAAAKGGYVIADSFEKLLKTCPHLKHIEVASVDFPKYPLLKPEFEIQFKLYWAPL